MLYLASDHAGYKLKEVAKGFLDFLEIEYQDLGTSNEEPVDYPDYAKKVVKKMNPKKDKGILFCGTGSGMCMMANRYKAIRAVVGNNEHEVLLGRAHNDANVLCLSGWDLKLEGAEKIVNIWLKTKFTRAKRHLRRLAIIKRYES